MICIELNEFLYPHTMFFPVVLFVLISMFCAKRLLRRPETFEGIHEGNRMKGVVVNGVVMWYPVSLVIGGNPVENHGTLSSTTSS